jgi:hypothetical protein
VKCGLSEQAMATRQNTRAMVFHAIQIRMIIPVHIFTDKQRNQAYCLMYRYALTMGLSSIHNNSNQQQEAWKKRKTRPQTTLFFPNTRKKRKPAHKTKLEEPFWNKTSCHNHVQELQQN